MRFDRAFFFSSQVPDGPNKVFCGGLPYDLSEDEIKELLQSYGRLKAFHLVKDKDAPNSKGYCFFEYADEKVTDEACKVMNHITASFCLLGGGALLLFCLNFRALLTFLS